MRRLATPRNLANPGCLLQHAFWRAERGAHGTSSRFLANGACFVLDAVQSSSRLCTKTNVFDSRFADCGSALGIPAQGVPRVSP